MAVPGLKYNDSSGVLTANCFPVRSFLRQGDDGGGAWLVAHKAEQRRRFKAVLCAKPLTYDAIHEQRQRTDKAGNTSVPPPTIKDEPHGGEEHEKSLDGFFLMKHCCIEDPSHLCSVNISGQNLTDAKHDDFIMFDNVAYVNAAENILPFECFKHFPILRELEQPLNALMNLKLSPDDFPHLQMCDLSYNNLTSRDLLSLGLLPELKVLHVMGNSLSKIPNDLAHPFEDEFNDNYQLRHRFTKLEVLMLDDNNLSDINTFSALAGLPRLKQLHLSKNNIYSVPHLMVVENNVIKEQSTVNTPGRKSGRKSSRRSRSYMSQLSRQRSKMISVVSDAEAEQGSHSHRQVTVSGCKLVSSSANHEIDSTVLSNVPPNSTVLSSSSSQIYAQNPEANKEPAITEVQEENLLNTDLSKPPELPEEILMTPPPDHYASDENAALPFPRLQYLNLSHNKIREEEGLLAVAVWPMLNELVIHDNPLTTQTSGDPPLLKRFLKNQFGIQITRLKPKEIEKPHIEVAPKEDRKVSSQVPRIPKVTVDELLALEAAMTQPALPPTEETTPRKALPPVKSPTISPKPMPTEQTTATESDENTFFMTQIDEQPIREIKTEQKDGQVAELKTERIKRKHHRVKVPEKYKGYEDIITLEDEHDESLPVPSDLNGNVKALQYALNHSLIYKDPEQVELQRPQPPHRLIYKPTPPKSKPMISHREKVDGVLENLKTRETFLETGLAEVFKHPQKYSKSFSDADKLLQQVQKKYNFVRTSSMHESAVDAKTLLEETKQMAQTLKP